MDVGRRGVTLGLILGSGLQPGDLGLTPHGDVPTPWGEVPLYRGYLGDRPVLALLRHGAGHTLPPGSVNWRGNAWALVRSGVRQVLATAAVGSLRRHLPPGQLVIPDQFLDFTQGRPLALDEERVVHLDFTHPYCPQLRIALARAACRQGIPIRGKGCYVAVSGPRYETAAEVRAYSRLGGDVVGMTGVPEVVMCREAGMCYATLAVVSNWAAGLTHRRLTHAEVETTVRRSPLLSVLAAAIPLVHRARSCRCAQA